MTENIQNKKCVLLVDDEPKLLRFIDIKLRLCGYEVITASCGKEALNLVRSKCPDLILLDVIMPEMDGYQVLKELRAFTQLPVIMFSAKSVDHDYLESLGANDFLAKPFDPDDLVKKIGNLIAA
jgi:two-component system, OmpR family, KDP operon response regulator KdpE